MAKATRKKKVVRKKAARKKKSIPITEQLRWQEKHNEQLLATNKQLSQALADLLIVENWQKERCDEQDRLAARLERKLDGRASSLSGWQTDFFKFMQSQNDTILAAINRLGQDFDRLRDEKSQIQVEMNDYVDYRIKALEGFLASELDRLAFAPPPGMFRRDMTLRKGLWRIIERLKKAKDGESIPLGGKME